ncbi:hypothetical protein [Sphingobacterium puteale]|uniref:hypothetical protein n=1 Tax=Sphingobacterium puteale TaxID=2420510 RepID=UPI003D96F510
MEKHQFLGNGQSDNTRADVTPFIPTVEEENIKYIIGVEGPDSVGSSKNEK